MSRKARTSRRRPAQPKASDPSDQTTLPLQPPNLGTHSLLPMEMKVGDRFIAEGFEWEIVTHPAALRGGKSLRARIQRPGLPESEREMTWPAHVRVEIRRGPTP